MENVPDHVLVFKAAGKLDAQDIKEFVRQIDTKLAKHEKIGVVSDVTALEGLTLDGLLEDLRAELAYIGKWHRFPNLAVVAEKGFIKKRRGDDRAMAAASAGARVPSRRDAAGGRLCRTSRHRAFRVVLVTSNHTR